ncbi:MAG: 2-phospho-L-lactate transferase [Nitrososphaerota archaeon]|nr:2-phospho-L-lactate transferase [Nitrososphaerota archaeon]MDG7023335.1 2-phospho-L-lactate transferase [Nitrososphaerota archaeon]
MRVVALAGGTGSAKLLRGLRSLPIDLTAVVNVGDNAWIYGVYVCPDVDIATYTLAGIVDAKRGWGIEGDTFNSLGALSRLGRDTWFRLGDLDLATCLLRTEMMREGASLTLATDRIRKALGAETPILPATDGPVETWVSTSQGKMHLQEFWVREGGKPEVNGVTYRGVRESSPTAKVRSAIRSADRVVVCPANPVTSIGPMLALPGFQELLAAAKGSVVALSPMVGRAPVSGPAGKLLESTGARPDSVGVAELYSDFADAILISGQDSSLRRPIEALGVRCALTDTMMTDRAAESRLARELLEL